MGQWAGRRSSQKVQRKQDFAPFSLDDIFLPSQQAYLCSYEYRHVLRDVCALAKETPR